MKNYIRLKSVFIMCLLVSFCIPSIYAQQQTLRGAVSSAETNEPLAGVNIKVKDKLTSTKTNAKGEYQINATAGDILVFSFVGYANKEVKVGKESVINIALTPATKSIEQVNISTGYQTINPERFVGAASKLDSTTFHDQAGKGILDRLKANVPGVLFYKEASVLPEIRGLSTFNTSSMSPLIVVDNFPMDERFYMNSINPNDVLDIAVLKDAAAASIWGARAGNGVIVITTKKGSYNQKIDLQFNSNIGITEKPDLFAYDRVAIADFIDIERFLFSKDYYNGDLNNTYRRPTISPVVEVLNQLKKGDIDATTAESLIDGFKKNDIRKDLDRYVYRNAVQQQHHLGVKGGTAQANYALSFGYNTSAPNVQHQKADQDYTVKGVFGFKPVKNFEVNTGIFYSSAKRPGSTMPIFSTIPYEALADANGKALPTSLNHRVSYLDTAGNGKLLDWQYRPLDEIKLADNNTHTQSINLNVGASYRIIDGLKASVLYNYRTQNGFQKELRTQETYFVRDLINRYTTINAGVAKSEIPMGGYLNLYDTETKSENLRAQLDYSKSWDKHSLSAMLVAERSEAVSSDRVNTFLGYDDEFETYKKDLNFNISYPIFQGLLGSTGKIPENNKLSSGNTSRFVSFLANASYTYKNLYTLYGSARRDGTNFFGATTNNKWKPMWSIGANWIISNEAFFDVAWINSMKARGSFGYMGNTVPISGLMTLTYDSSPDELTNLKYAVINAPPNPTLRWEQIQTINTGIDFSLFHNRLSGSMDYFQKKSIDLIANMPMDPTTGISKQQINSASLKTKGTEINLNSRNLVGPINWTTGLGFSYNKTIVTKFADNGYRASDFINFGINPAEGENIYSVSSYKWAGLDPTNGDPQGYLNGEVSKDYQAIANDSIQNQVLHGSSRPLFFGYLNNTVSWKNISLSVNISYQFDYYFRKSTINYINLIVNRTVHPDYYKRWQKPGDEMRTTVPAMNYPPTQNADSFYANSEVHVKRADYIRLRDLRLQYMLNKDVISRLPVQSIQFFLNASNLNILFWRANKEGLDPDLSYPSEYNSFPTPNTWTMGFNLQF